MRKMTNREVKAFTRYAFQQDFISEGTGRKVYKYGSNLVLKIAKNRNGRKQNIIEAKRFAQYGEEKLAKIVAWHPKLVIMERVKVVEINEHNDLALWLDEITGICSMDHCSQGYRGSHLVAYDYGDTKSTYTKQMHDDYYYRENVL